MADWGFAFEPGTAWANETGATWEQVHCNWENSCGSCIELDGSIAPYWPTPFHNNCNCLAVPIYPGTRSKPFVDFLAKFRRQSSASKARALGDGNRKLIDAGLVAWDLIVTPSRIRPLKEVVQAAGLSLAQLVEAGIRSDVAKRALGLEPPVARNVLIGRPRIGAFEFSIALLILAELARREAARRREEEKRRAEELRREAELQSA